jgi:hypothetical protein
MRQFEHHRQSDYPVNEAHPDALLPTNALVDVHLNNRIWNVSLMNLPDPKAFQSNWHTVPMLWLSPEAACGQA